MQTQTRERDIYMLDGGPGRQYIGQTVDLNRRLVDHRYKCKGGNTAPLYEAVREDPQGWDAFPERVLFTAELSDLQASAVETWHIHFHDTCQNGLNERPYDRVRTGWEQSQVTRDKISASNTGRKMPPRSDEYRAKQRAAQLGRVVSEESKEKNRQAHLGKVTSDETKALQSAAQLGKAKSKQHNANVSATHRARGITFSKEAHEKARQVNTGRKVPAQDRYRMGNGGVKFRAENIDRVMEMRAAGIAMRVIAEDVGVAECTIPRWIKWYESQVDSQK